MNLGWVRGSGYVNINILPISFPLFHFRLEYVNIPIRELEIFLFLHVFFLLWVDCLIKLQKKKKQNVWRSV